MSEQDSITFFFKKPSFHLSFKFYIEYKRIKKSLIMYFNMFEIPFQKAQN